MDNKICGIYKIQCDIDDKSYVYIGKSVDIKRRWYEHDLELSKNKHCNKFMQNIYNKHGQNVFCYDVIEECEESLLNEKEIEYIALYKENNNFISMNLTDGGDGGDTYQYLSPKKLEEIKQQKREWGKKYHRVTDEGKRRISVASSRPKSEEAKKNMRLAWEKRKKEGRVPDISGEKNPMYGVHRCGKDHPLYGKRGKLSPRYGKKHTDETKRKMSEAKKGKNMGSENPNYGNHMSEENRQKISNINSKKILCLDLEYNVIASYKNNKECIMHTSYNHYHCISYNHKIKNIEDAKIGKDNLIFIYEEDYMKLKGGDNNE